MNAIPDDAGGDLVRAANGDVLLLIPPCCPEPASPVSVTLRGNRMDVLQNGSVVFSFGEIGPVWRDWITSAGEIVVSEFDDSINTTVREGVVLTVIPE